MTHFQRAKDKQQEHLREQQKYEENNWSIEDSDRSTKETATTTGDRNKHTKVSYITGVPEGVAGVPETVVTGVLETVTGIPESDITATGKQRQ